MLEKYSVLTYSFIFFCIAKNRIKVFQNKQKLEKEMISKLNKANYEKRKRVKSKYS